VGVFRYKPIHHVDLGSQPESVLTQLGHRFGQHNSTSALGEVVRTVSTSSSRVAGGEDPVFGPTSTS